jgi:polyhydroxyalkanoate synthesis regulator phasin
LRAVLVDETFPRRLQPKRAATTFEATGEDEPMLRDNPVLKKMIETGEERVGKIATQLLSNEKLMGALQKTVSAALEAKGLVERNVQSVLSTMNIPTAADVQRLQGKIDELERVFEALSAKIAELQKREMVSPPPPPN